KWEAEEGSVLTAKHKPIAVRGAEAGHVGLAVAGVIARNDLVGSLTELIYTHTKVGASLIPPRSIRRTENRDVGFVIAIEIDRGPVDRSGIRAIIGSVYLEGIDVPARIRSLPGCVIVGAESELQTYVLTGCRGRKSHGCGNEAIRIARPAGPPIKRIR